MSRQTLLLLDLEQHETRADCASPYTREYPLLNAKASYLHAVHAADVYASSVVCAATLRKVSCCSESRAVTLLKHIAAVRLSSH